VSEESLAEYFAKEGEQSNVSSRAKVMERVRGLIAQANDTDSPAEADAFRAKADALMLKYSISRFEISDKRESASQVDSIDYDMAWYNTDPYHMELWTIMQRVAAHCRVVAVHWQFTGMTIPVVGTEGDRDYFDMLFTTVSLEMSRGLEPHPSRDRSMIENLVMMKEAGMKWERIGELLIGIDQLDHYDRNMGVKFTKLYTDYCAEHNRPRLRTSPKTYQHSFVTGFVGEIVDRLYRIRKEAQAVYDQDHDGSGTELVLADMKSVVDAKTRQLYGNPPASSYRGGGRQTQRKVDPSAMAAGRQAASQVDLGSRRVGTHFKEIES
jgi:hypothetical protein